jgi:LemA protein
MIGLWVVLALLVLLGMYAVSTYNRLVGYRQEVEKAWNDIDLQLKRRHDLIPNLVETVKGVMKFEQDTLSKVVEARGKAVGASDPAARLEAEGQLSAGLGRLMAVWEQYPELKSIENAGRLQEELTSTENRIAYSRGYYNDLVANFNTLQASFPASLVAGPGGFSPRQFFKVPEQEKEAPKVSF